ncbi:MAG TPA: hypothetical protein EYG39_01910, partial [Rhodothermales bacterium]|nr:hypothetical protein [Rhodothermales bacterium]
MTPPLRILTVAPNLGPGGTQRVAQNYAIGYAEAGHASAVLGYGGGGPRAESLRRAGLEVFAEAEDAVDAAAEWHPTVVHVHRGGDPFAPITPVLDRLAAVEPRPTFIETSVFARADDTATGRLFDLHLQLTRWCMWKWRKWSRSIRPEPVGVVMP